VHAELSVSTLQLSPDGLKDGLAASASAASPETNGAANEVPLPAANS
jgi:hypothetical protein